MKVEYTLTRNDFFHWFLHMRERRLARWRKSRWYPVIFVGRWLPTILFSFTIAYLLWWTILYTVLGITDDPRVIGGLALLCLVITLIVYPIVRPEGKRSQESLRARLLMNRLIRQSKLAIGYQCELIVTSEQLILNGVKKSTEGGLLQTARFECLLAWEQVQSIEEGLVHAYVINKANVGFFIPKAAFPDALAYRAFVEETRRLWSQSATATAITASLPPALGETAVKPQPSKSGQQL